MRLTTCPSVFTISIPEIDSDEEMFRMPFVGFGKMLILGSAISEMSVAGTKVATYTALPVTVI